MMAAAAAGINGSNKLVPGEVRDIALGKQTAPVYLQVIHLKAFEMEAKEPGSVASFRYKIVLSDSLHFIQGTLAGPLNHLFESKMIETCSIIKLSQYHVNDMKGHKILYVSGIDVGDVEKFPQKVGIPGSVEASLNAENPANAPPPVMTASSMHVTNNGGGVSGGLVGASNNNRNEFPANPVPAMAASPTTTTGKRSFENSSDGGLSKAEISELMPLIQPINTLNPYNDRYYL